MAAESVLAEPADLAKAFEAEVSALQRAEPLRSPGPMDTRQRATSDPAPHQQ